MCWTLGRWRWARGDPSPPGTHLQTRSLWWCDLIICGAGFGGFRWETSHCWCSEVTVWYRKIFLQNMALVVMVMSLLHNARDKITLSWEAKKNPPLSYLNTEGRQLDMVSFCSLKVTNGSWMKNETRLWPPQDVDGEPSPFRECAPIWEGLSMGPCQHRKTNQRIQRKQVHPSRSAHWHWLDMQLTTTFPEGNNPRTLGLGQRWGVVRKTSPLSSSVGHRGQPLEPGHPARIQLKVFWATMALLIS